MELNAEQQQCYLGALGYYSLRRQDGTLAIDGLAGEATRQAILRFQTEHRQRPDGTVLWVDGIWGPATERALRQVIGLGEAPQNGESPRWVRQEDFICRCGGLYCNGWPDTPHERTLELLEQIGAHFGRPIQAHSGLRCPRWNARWKGSPNSRHLTGGAMDFHLEGVTPEELYDYADSLLGETGGLGLYDWGIHLDDRREKARWRESP